MYYKYNGIFTAIVFFFVVLVFSRKFKFNVETNLRRHAPIRSPATSTNRHIQTNPQSLASTWQRAWRPSFTSTKKKHDTATRTMTIGVCWLDSAKTGRPTSRSS